MISSERRRHYLQAMGIEQWLPRSVSVMPECQDELTAKSIEESAVEPPREVLVQQPEPVSLLEEQPAQQLVANAWQPLEQQVKSCQACALHSMRTQTVFGVGDYQARWMIIGEAPGAQEDAQGEPFVGRAGLLLNEMLNAIGLQRDAVFIANILKCRPPNNRDPRADEVAACSGFLQAQVELVKPEIILAVGRIAAHNLLQTTEPMGRLRGQVHHYGKTPVIVIYHPAYLLRSPLEKRKAWQDLLFARKLIQ